MEAPMLTGRIEAWPVIMFTWSCPNCNGVHARVAMGETVKCLNPRCGKEYERSSFRFIDSEKIARIMADNTKRMEDEVNKDIEAQEAKLEAIS